MKGCVGPGLGKWRGASMPSPGEPVCLVPHMFTNLGGPVPSSSGFYGGFIAVKID